MTEIGGDSDGPEGWQILDEAAFDGLLRGVEALDLASAGTTR
jgi:hypothetical protein